MKVDIFVFVVMLVLLSSGCASTTAKLEAKVESTAVAENQPVVEEQPVEEVVEAVEEEIEVVPAVKEVTIREKVMKSYLGVTKYDGIDKDEAILLAQSEVIFSGYDETYYLEDPNIVIEEKKKWGIKFYPINKTLKDIPDNPSLFVEINRRNGQVRMRKE